MPPSASPRWKRSSRTSVALERYNPAIQVAAAATRKITSSAPKPSELMALPQVGFFGSSTSAKPPLRFVRCLHYLRT